MQPEPNDAAQIPDSPETGDLLRFVEGWLADVAISSSRSLRHAGPCGQRAFCPRRCSPGYRTLELLANGDLLVACCLRTTLRPADREYAEFRGAFLP